MEIVKSIVKVHSVLYSTYVATYWGIQADASSFILVHNCDFMVKHKSCHIISCASKCNHNVQA